MVAIEIGGDLRALLFHKLGKRFGILCAYPAYTLAACHIEGRC